MSMVDGSKQRYVVVWPREGQMSGKEAEEPQDILIVLHGHGSDRWQFVEDSRGECAGARDVAARHGMVYVSPDYRAPRSWMGPEAEADLVQIIQQLREGGPPARCGPHVVRRIVLCGGSMGGTAALTFAALHPYLLDGVVSLNGMGDLSTYENFSEAIEESYSALGHDVGEERMRRSASHHPQRLSGLAMASTTGGLDESVPPASALRLVEALEHRGQAVLSIHRPAVGHETGFADTVAALEYVLASLHNQNVAIRSSFTNSLYRFQSAASLPPTCRVAFMGGSITQMDGYRPMVMSWLQQRFPAQAFDFVHAGVSSTCSTTGAFRLQSDVLSFGPLDLFFLEFAVNDFGDANHEWRECVRGMEGIVRQAREAQPHLDIVVIHFVNEAMLAQIQAGRTPTVVAAHEQVMCHYGVSSVYAAREVAQRIAAGDLTWEDYGGAHPTAAGNAIVAGMCTRLLSTAWAREAESDSSLSVMAPHRLPELLDEGSYVRGRWLSPAATAVLWEPGWVWAVPPWTTIEGTLRDTFGGSPLLCCSTPGAECSVSFNGTVFGMFVLAGPDAGVVESAVDAGPWVATDLYHQFSVGLHYPRTVVLASDLSPNTHVVRMRLRARADGGRDSVRVLQFATN